MKSRVIAVGVVALITAAALAAACGGGGKGNGQEAGIRTRQGLGVAALAAGASRTSETARQAAQGSPVPGAPSVDTGVGVGKGGGGDVAPDFYPYPTLQQSQTGITVQGFGSATVTADSAIVEFYFGGKATGVVPQPSRDSSVPGSSGSGSASAGGAEPQSAPATPAQQQITEAALKPVVDAIVATGVARTDVEVIVTPYYGEPAYGGSATIRATVRKVASVDAVVQAATKAAAGLTDISMQGTNVSYTVSDCAALEKAAMEAAVKDARERGTNFAGVLGVGLGDVAGASNYSSSLYGGSPCDSNFTGPYPMGGIAYAEGQTPDVQLMATVTITFNIK